MSAIPFTLAPAVWSATAVAATATPPLAESHETDVAVVGAGYAGMSTALHLASKGVGVTVLEANEPGWGGSGRNGGQVIPGLKYDPDELEMRLGSKVGPALVAFAGNTVDTVFRLIEEHSLQVPRVRNGWIQGAHSQEGLVVAKSRADQWRRRGVEAQLLDAAQMADHLGCETYLGGWLDPRAGALQPLTYARELCRVAQAKGARIHGGTRVARIEKHGAGWQVTTAQGQTVHAGKVVVCSNGYSGDLLPRLRRTIIAPNTYQVATGPLPDSVRASIFRYGQVSSDTRKLLLYFRLDHEGRFMLGGRGPFREPTGPHDWAHLERVARQMFPQLKDVPFEYRWCGRVALTQDFMPHVHEPEPGLIANIGCQGRGIGLETAMGMALADYCATGRRDMLPFPVTPINTIPFHGLQRLYFAAVVAWYRMRDASSRSF